jgi:hypothetical protein
VSGVQRRAPTIFTIRYVPHPVHNLSTIRYVPHPVQNLTTIRYVPHPAVNCYPLCAHKQ